MTEAVEHMVQRFLTWKLPENFNPDAGISFKPTFNDHLPVPMRHNPTGTNLFDYVQAKAMVMHMLEGAPTDQGGWIVGNGDGTKWRTWGAMGPEWTTDRNAATRYYRRDDAEAVHRDDEDAWTIVPFGDQAPQASTEAAWCDDTLPCARYTAALAAKDAQIAELEDRLRKANKAEWLYYGDDPSSDQCRDSIDECISEDFEWCNKPKGDHVLQISGAKPVPDMWVALRYFTEAEMDERQDDAYYVYTVHATEEEARQALKEKNDDA